MTGLSVPRAVMMDGTLRPNLANRRRKLNAGESSLCPANMEIGAQRMANAGLPERGKTRLA